MFEFSIEIYIIRWHFVKPWLFTLYKTLKWHELSPRYEKTALGIIENIPRFFSKSTGFKMLTQGFR